MSPMPSRHSAPSVSRMVRESKRVRTLKAMRQGKLALMTPVTMSTLGPLGGEDEVDAHGARHLRQVADRVLDLGGAGHHEVGQLVDDDDDVAAAA